MITYDLSIDNATWTTPQHCAPGSVALSTAVEARWPILLNREGAYGCYNRRSTAGGGKSIHGDGRAIDIGIGWQPSAAQKAALHECTEFLAANAKHLGIQRIIYNNRAWKASVGWYAYADGKHFDHAHVEQTMEASWSNPLPLAQAMAVLTPPTPRPDPEPDPSQPPVGGEPVTNVVNVKKGSQLLDAVFVGQFDSRGIAVRLEWSSGERRDRYVNAGCPTAVLDLSQVKACSVNRVPSGDRFHAWSAADFSDVG